MRTSPDLALPLAAVAALLGSACIDFSDPGGPQCSRDTDCTAGECTNTGICVPEGTSLRVVISWTIGGVAPTPAESGPCAGVSELEVRFQTSAEGATSFRPVTCSLGQISFDKLPPDFARVTLSAYSTTGSVLDAVSGDLAPVGETVLDFDLQF